MTDDGIQKGENTLRDKEMDAFFANLILPDPKEAAPKTIEEAIRAGDWIAVARIRAATIAHLERASHEDADGDGRVAGRKADARDEAVVRDGNGYLDADGRDPYGHKYYANFGYDTQGNYNDSYGGNFNTKTGEYKTGDGRGTSDLKHGVSERDGTVFNHVTNEGVYYDPEQKKYYRFKVDPATGKPTIEMKDGNPVECTKEDSERFKADAIRNNPEATPEQMAKWEAQIIQVDRHRQQQAEARKPPEGTQQSTTSPGTSQGSTGTAAGGLGGGLTNIGVATQEQLGTIIGGVGAELQRARAKQRHSYSGLQRAEQNAKNSSWTTAIDPGKHEVAKWRLAATPSPSNAIAAGSYFGAGNPENPLLRTNIAPIDNPLLPKQRVFQDENGYMDAAGGYTDKDKGYCFRHGGYLASDGSYIDRLGNFVDDKGNLWLANNKSGKPDFPKKDGVNYVDLLRSKDEDSFIGRRTRDKTSYEEWVSANGAAMGDGLQALENSLKKVTEDSEVRAKANASAVYRGEGSFAHCYVDKEGNLWLDGSLTPVAKREGVDYADLLKKAAQGKMDEWTGTGDLTPAEIAGIKNDLKAIAAAEEAVSKMAKQNLDDLQGRVSEMAEISDAVRSNQRANNAELAASPKPKAEDISKSGDAHTQEDVRVTATVAKAVSKVLKKNVDNLEGQVSELAEVAKEMKEREAEAAPKSKFAPQDQKTVETQPASTVTSSFGAAPQPAPAAQEADTGDEMKTQPVSLRRPPKTAASPSG